MCDIDRFRFWFRFRFRFLFFWILFCVLRAQDVPSIVHLESNLPISWTNSITYGMEYSQWSKVMLETQSFDGLYFTCGFMRRNIDEDNWLFVVSLAPHSLQSSVGEIEEISPASAWAPASFVTVADEPTAVWSANPTHKVQSNATVELTPEAGLVLKDSDGTLVWQTNTFGNLVTGMKLSEMGNLVLFDHNNITVWQSFDHPTDTLLLGQKLMPGQSLISDGGLFSFFLTRNACLVHTLSNPPLVYSSFSNGTKANDIKFTNSSSGSSIIIEYSDHNSYSISQISFEDSSVGKYIKFESDGHLKAYENKFGYMRSLVADNLLGLDACEYPMVCGEYGVCSVGGQCRCPLFGLTTASYLKPKDLHRPELGCIRITPLSCKSLQNHILVKLENITYFPFIQTQYFVNFNITNIEICKQACLKNCSCKAAVFEHAIGIGTNVSDSIAFNGSIYSSEGRCYLAPQVYSLIESESGRRVGGRVVFIKVQTENHGHHTVSIILGSSFAASFALFLLIVILIYCFQRRKYARVAVEDNLDQIPGIPKRFTYEFLKASTENFNKKLGKGGFGSVYEGTLNDGSKVAVKLLNGSLHVKKSFLAEVKTIGRIHHFNLARLVGYCVESSCWALVYEYMCNGSLENWIFQRNNNFSLDWKTRREIILDIAKGMAYLHEGCQQKIIHLDIKPQNILLDKNFNAKVSDFGLSKLIERDQSQVVTTMRGTPGYLAPEWLSSVITEKVDVYSFGVVMLEIVCGRKIFEHSQPEECKHLLSLFKQKAEEDQLLDMVDKSSEDMQLHGEEVVAMMKVAAWCLQSDFAKRPSMSLVIKALEGVADVEDPLDYNFFSPPFGRTIAAVDVARDDGIMASSILPSLLSGPR
ncbi:G-type lectin S-receptor-like serine/threonine-protein kinase SD2-5 [Malania oleifera]|uniref:G-type lectin S-receptor-like serine/threonine-protein kinase SD2-5 n=1 Tax=Malania oleifera TaxID=397392 RepID=UPI0025AE7265|nr:G-type lectin S-receptor-like serine/threonine-protein kinase SD2-5 [Malania oleifera]